MKTFLVENNYGSPLGRKPAWSFLPDSALCNAGKPFFIPENAMTTEAFIAPAVKITRLGKSVAERFARRYYSQAAPAIHFRDTGLRKALVGNGLPADMSQSFDRSLIAGDFIPADRILGTRRLCLLKNGKICAEWSEEELTRSVDALFPEISAANTLKMGDILIPGISEGVRIEIGDNLELKADGETLLFIAIK